MKILLTSIKDAWHLFYPNSCIICESFLPVVENNFCLSCYHSLPWTDHHQVRTNAFKLKFSGRLNPEFACALLYFQESGIVQQTIHKLKYMGDKHLAKSLGVLLGRNISELPERDEIDYVVPVPLHRRKKIKRGYNQSLCIAQGIYESCKINVLDKAIIKNQNQESQTRKSRSERFENVLNSFSINCDVDLNDKHVLIVDDVCTTGATLEACAVKLLEKYNCKISFAVLALAQ